MHRLLLATLTAAFAVACNGDPRSDNTNVDATAIHDANPSDGMTAVDAKSVKSDTHDDVDGKDGGIAAVDGFGDASEEDAAISDAGDWSQDAGTVDASTGIPDTNTAPFCGDGTLAATEACDDGNVQAGDGCDGKCDLEVNATATCAARHKQIIGGTKSLHTGGGLTGQLVVHGADACAHVLDASQRTVVASGRLSQGRVVVLGHNSFLSDKLGASGNDNHKLALGAIGWLSGGKSKPVVGLVGNFSKLKTLLVSHSIQTASANVAAPGKVDVLVTTAQSGWTASQVASLVAFVSKGGGLLIGGQAWWWGTSHDKKLVAMNYMPNGVINLAGVTFSTETAVQGAIAVSQTAPSPWTNARVALQLAKLHAAGQANLPLAVRKALVPHAGVGVSVLPLSMSGFFATAKAFHTAIGPLIPTPQNPVVPGKEPLQLLALYVDAKHHLWTAAKDLFAHPAAANFPGKPTGDLTTVTRKLTVDGTHAGRHAKFSASGAKAPARRATGLWALAGKAVTVSMPSAAAKAGIRVMIGAHSDKLWHKTKIERHPNVVRSWPIPDSGKAQVGSIFGGPLYLYVPVGAKLGSFAVTLSGAVPAPLYQVGVTSGQQWLTSRDAPAPWAELVGKHVALTIPSSHVRKLADPGALLAYWDSVLEASATLAAIPLKRPRRERITADRQIGGGYMHSGYPIMTHLDAPKAMVDLAELKAKGNWGLFHEIGHNHQWKDTIIPKTGEVTVNLWSVHSCEKLTAKKTGCHNNTVPAKAKQILNDWLAKGGKYADWTPWNALQMYLQLKDAFGWQAYQKVWQVYYALPAGQQPKNDQQRIDQWCVRMSKVVGKRLGWFFTVWAVPVTHAGCRSQVANLPPWLGDPMRAYFPYPAELTVMTAVGVAPGKANARVNVIDPGGVGSVATLYWGPKDGGKNQAAWANKVTIGAPQAGVAPIALKGLKSGKKLFYRAMISNSLSQFWTPTAASFVTK
ncbi:MAG: M60 family metallopeptidase [Myxococcales bacterium]|nr:M60 family metallopeptidase [Myxococcales bacterium]